MPDLSRRCPFRRSAVGRSRQPPPHSVGPRRISDLDRRVANTGDRPGYGPGLFLSRLPFRHFCLSSWTLSTPARHCLGQPYCGAIADLKLAATQIALTVTFLAYQTRLMSDAILRTLGRLLITRTHLLEWVTAAQAEDAYTHELSGMYRRMGGGIVPPSRLLAELQCLGRNES